MCAVAAVGAASGAAAGRRTGSGTTQTTAATTSASGFLRFLLRNKSNVLLVQRGPLLIRAGLFVAAKGRATIIRTEEPRTTE